MTTTNEQFYIDKVINGDTNAFAHLVESYKDMVFSLALKIIKSREEAEEVAQDSFIKAFKNLNKFKGESKFSTWLYKITYNNCIDVISKRAKSYSVIDINEKTIHKIEAIENTLQTIERKERADIIKKCLDFLPEDEKSILWLFYFNELSLKEITEVTSLTESNIKVKLHRARKRLLTIVQEKVEPELIKYYGS